MYRCVNPPEEITAEKSKKTWEEVPVVPQTTGRNTLKVFLDDGRNYDGQ